MGDFVAVARLRLHGDHFGDDLARPLNHHAVAQPNVLLADVVDVVQGGARDRDAADGHRLHHRHRGQHACAPDLPAHLAQRGDGAFGGVLVGDCPARGARRRPQLPLPVQTVDLDDHAVGSVVQFGAARRPLATEGDSLLHPAGDPRVRVHGEAPRPQLLQDLPLRAERRALAIADAVCPEAQASARRDARIELAQAARRRVARVRKQRLALLGALAVDALELVDAQVHLAAHFHHARGRVEQVCPVCRRSGIWRTVRRLGVTTSPRTPSPRVAPTVKMPSS
jgi:hypothetical protein